MTLSPRAGRACPQRGLTDNSFAWSINGILAIGMTDGSLWQIVFIDGTGQHKLLEIPQRISGLDFSPDGKTLAYLWDYDGPPGQRTGGCNVRWWLQRVGYVARQ